jgi:hypothetical protein
MEIHFKSEGFSGVTLLWATVASAVVLCSGVEAEVKSSPVFGQEHPQTPKESETKPFLVSRSFRDAGAVSATEAMIRAKLITFLPGVEPAQEKKEHLRRAPKEFAFPKKALPPNMCRRKGNFVIRL